MSNNDVLPLSTKRRCKIENPENIQITQRTNNKKEDIEIIKLQERYNLASKAIDSLPEIINIAQHLVQIKNIEVQADNMVKVIREKGEYLQKEADAFVKKHIAKRDTFLSKGQVVNEILRNLNDTLRSGNYSDDVQKELIKIFNNSIEKVLQDKDIVEIYNE